MRSAAVAEPDVDEFAIPFDEEPAAPEPVPAPAAPPKKEEPAAPKKAVEPEPAVAKSGADEAIADFLLDIRLDEDE